MKRKLRTGIGNNYQVSSIAKQPTLDDVRDETKKSNMILVGRMKQEIHNYMHPPKKDGSKKKPMARTKSPSDWTS